ncbi:hypothetical protein ACFQZZ_04680 [Nocardia sp. GCM10030253]|uniref:hypothetical protein n=1 Tax=Nocardia sp. GCM10030253 TaxID=3273404 RepID=UPI00362D45AB
MKSVRSLLRWAGYALMAGPLACRPVAVRLRVPRRMLGVSFPMGARSGLRAAVHSVLAIIVCVLSWFLAFLATLAAVRGIAYPLIGDNDLEHSWGGPTLAGAWAVHALAVVSLPAWLALLAGLGVVQVRLSRQLLGRTGPWWPVPVSLVLGASGVLLFISWLHQV